MKKYILLVLFGFTSQIIFAQNKELATKNQIIKLLDTSGAKGIVFISNNDCISCVSYITATFKPSYNVLYATDNSDLYSYLKELGINIPTKKMVKDPNILKDLAKIYTQSRLIIYENGNLKIIKLDANINKGNYLDRMFEQHTIKKSIISIPDSLNLEHFKGYSSKYSNIDKSFHFYDERFNFEHVFDSNLVYSKFYMNVSQSTQNYYFKEIANSLKLKPIIKADSASGTDANYYLKLMGQSKTSLIFVNDSFEIFNIKYCTNDTKSNDTNTAVGISKITVLIKDFDNEPKIIKLFFKLQYGKDTYFDRSLKTKLTSNYIIVPYEKTDSIGMLIDGAKLSLALFDLKNKDIYAKPSKLFSTNILATNCSNIVFDCLDKGILLFDNLNRKISFFNGIDSNGIVVNSFKEKDLKFIYDIYTDNNGIINILCNKTNGAFYYSKFHYDSGQLKLIEEEKINDEYLSFAFFNLHKINGDKVDINKKQIIFYNN